MVMVSRFSNFHNESSENDELREYELSRSHCICAIAQIKKIHLKFKRKNLTWPPIVPSQLMVDSILSMLG